MVIHEIGLTWIHYWFLRVYGVLSRMHIPWSCHSEAYALKRLGSVIFLEYARFCGVQNFLQAGLHQLQGSLLRAGSR